MNSAATHHFKMAMHERRTAVYSQSFGIAYAKIAWRKAHAHMIACRAIINGSK